MAVTTHGESNSAHPATEPRRRSSSRFNPATGERIGAVPTIKPAQVQAVVDDVAEVQPFWAQLSLAERARYLRRAGAVLVDHSDEIAELLTREQGKPRVEAYTMELMPTIDLFTGAPTTARGSSPTSRSSTRRSCSSRRRASSATSRSGSSV